MIKINKKVIFIMALILFVPILNIKKSYAGITTIKPLPKQHIGEISPSEYNKNTKLFFYTWQKNISPKITIKTYVYNMNGEALMADDIKLQDETFFKSGTWAGVHISETIDVSWRVEEVKIYEKRKKYICYYKDSTETKTITHSKSPVKASSCNCDSCWFSPWGDPASNPDGQCYWKTTVSTTTPGGNYTTEETYDYYAEPSQPCKKSYNNQEFDRSEETYVDIEVTTSDEYVETIMEKIYESTYNEAIGILNNSVGILQFINVNDYPEKLESMHHTNIQAIATSGSYPGPSKSGSAYQTYEYTPKKVCINLRTSAVRYGADCDRDFAEDNDYKSDRKEIPNTKIYDNKINKNIVYWHYFIPLNTKNSKENFYFRLIGNPQQKLSTEMCQYAMETYVETYKNIIIPNLNGDLFDGEYDRRKENSNDWKKVVDNNGCYYSNTVYIPITQKFYNEQEDSTFKGFNFYYKPIDVNNPFPNGIPTNSIWTEKETDKLTSTNLNKDNITYIANVTNPNAIRNYKDEMITHGKYQYTRWDNMYLNGVSNFIENSGFVNRYVDKNNIYKLGCGPHNSKKTNSDGTTNHLYQRWCESE